LDGWYNVILLPKQEEAMTDFIVRFEGMTLSPEVSRHLQTAIGAAVDSALGSAAFEPDPEGDGRCVFIPRKWLGRYIIPAANLEKTPALLKQQLAVTGRPG
jgi:hypothetical protein